MTTRFSGRSTADSTDFATIHVVRNFQARIGLEAGVLLGEWGHKRPRIRQNDLQKCLPGALVGIHFLAGIRREVVAGDLQHDLLFEAVELNGALVGPLLLACWL